LSHSQKIGAATGKADIGIEVEGPIAEGTEGLGMGWGHIPFPMAAGVVPTDGEMTAEIIFEFSADGYHCRFRLMQLTLLKAMERGRR
jgi:hypothetical protein